MIDLSKPWPPGLNRRTVLPALAVFALLLLVLYFGDRDISQWMRGTGEPWKSVARWLTRWGESDWILIPTFVGWLGAYALSLLTRENLKAATSQFAKISGFIFVAVGLPGLVSALLKRGLGRGRPETWTAEAPLTFRPFNWTDYDYQGFPSGHATTSFAFAMAVGFLWPRAFWPALVFAALVALTRIAVAQHYPTDIAAGAVLGIIGAYAVRNMFAARGWVFEARDGRIVRR